MAILCFLITTFCFDSCAAADDDDYTYKDRFYTQREIDAALPPDPLNYIC